ncbi:MAG: hypothetical protein II840_10225 [Kiritimatiellae bacterium]|nr:hypothetical protein [Kiritimatiellia bacterium]
MSKLFNWAAAHIVAAFAFALPLAAMATTTYSTDHTVTGSGTAYTSSAGNANVTWQNFNFRAAISKSEIDALEGAGGDAHGYYFYLNNGDTDIGETEAAVKLDSITLMWGSNGGGDIGTSDTPYLVVTTADNTPVIIGVSAAGEAFAANGTSTFAFSDVVLASNAKYRFYFYKNDVSGLTVGATLSGAVTGRVNGRWHNTSGDRRADYNDICCNGGNGYSVNCSFVVSPVETTDVTVIETSNSAVTLAGGNSSLPVVIEGKVADGVVEVGSAANVAHVVTVDGEATTLELTDSLTATAFYFPATVTIDASSLSVDPTGEDASKTTTLLSGALKYTTTPTVVLPAATAGMIYETNITGSGISVTVVKGVDCVETIAGNTSWSAIKPAGWIDSSIGDKPAIAITYEGEEPVTLTFDEAVTAGSLTLTGNIVVEASAAATFGTVIAGAGSVVEMANLTITTQSGSGVYRYRSDYPSAVPNNSLTYEYVGTADSENPGTVNLNGMRGTVKTSGYMSITGYYPILTNAKLDVVSGTTTLTAGGQAICGYITIREGATLVNTATDSLAYSSYNSIIDIYGTLDMGTSRWTVWSGATFNLRGGEITGVGESNNGAIDLMGTCNVNVYADSTISANIKFRDALSNITVNDGVTLTISGVTKPGYVGGGITKKGAGTLKFTSDPYVPGGIAVEAGTLAFDTESDVDPVVTYTAAVLNSANMDYVSASNWKGRVVVSTVAAGDTATQVALNKTGNANSYLTLNGISGNAWCAGSNYTVEPAITLAGDVNFQNGSSKKAVTFRKIAAGTGNLSLKSWSGCTGITYGFTTLDADNYTGTIQLDGSVLTFNVGDILKAGAAVGDNVLPLTVTNNATVNLSNVKINGKLAGCELREDGVYYTVANVTITVPMVENTTVTVTAGGSAVEPTSPGANTYEVDYGAEVVVTYAVDADAYELVNGTIELTATESTEVTAPTVTPYVAWIYDGNNEIIGKYKQSVPAVIAFGNGTGDKARFAEALDATYHNTLIAGCSYDATTITYTRLPTVAVIISVSGVWTNKYPTIAAAVAAAGAGDTITLVDNVTLAESVEVAAGKSVTIDLDGNTITGPASGYAFSNAGEITIENGTITGAGGVAENTAGGASIAVSSGSYTATGDLFGNVEGGTIAVSGGTFDAAVPAEYCADGYEPKDNGNGTYTVRVDLGWIYEAADHPEYTGSWSNDVVYSEGKVHIEDGNTYTANRPSDGQFVTVAMTLSFDDANDEDEDVGDAKAAVKLASGETSGTYKFQLYTTNELGAAAWANATAGVTATTNVDYTFVFVLDLTNKIYTASIVNGTTTNALTVGGASDIPFAYQGTVTPVQKIDFIGAGTVTSITGSYEDAEAPVEEFVGGDTIGSVEIGEAQAIWLNGQTDYAALYAKIATMTQTAFNNAHLLNLNVLDENYQDYQKGDFVVTDFRFTTEENVEYVVVEVTLERHGALDGGINGTLKLMGTTQLDVPFEVKVTSEFTFDGAGTTTLKYVKDDTTLFYKPVIE